MSSHRYEIIESWFPTEQAAINYCKRQAEVGQAYDYRPGKRSGFIVYRRAKKGGTNKDV